MAQYVGSRPYTVGGVYTQYRNAASVRRGLQGLGDTGGCAPGDMQCFENLGQYLNTGGLDSATVGLITIGVLALYMLSGYHVSGR